MIKASLQRRGNALYPYSQEDLAAIRKYPENQILTAQIKGCRKPRSVQQNRWIHAMFRLVADNTDDPDWDTAEKVKRNVKIIVKFFKESVIVRGNKVYFELRSFAFDEMDQDEANIVYEQAKTICAKKLGVPPEELEAQAREEG